MYTGRASSKTTMTFIQAENALYSFRQGRKMSNAKYLEVFKARVEVYRHLGGEPGTTSARVSSQLTVNGHDPDNATEEQRSIATKECREEYLANLFIRNSD